MKANFRVVLFIAVVGAAGCAQLGEPFGRSATAGAGSPSASMPADRTPYASQPGGQPWYGGVGTSTAGSP